jgi:hypothetical protein
MDIKPNNSRDITPGRPGGMPGRPRPVMSDFAPRRPAGSDVAPGRPHQPTLTPQTPAAPAPAPMTPRPARPSMDGFGAQPARPAAPAPRPAEFPAPEAEQNNDQKAPKAPRERNRTGHAGLVGLGVFVILTALLLSPLIPGKVVDSLPGVSQSSSSGDQALACAHDVTNTKSTTTVNTKLGAPLVYKYTTTTTLQGTCDGKQQSVVGGRSSQFNPLSMAIDVITALVVACAVTFVWRKIFASKD